MNNYRNNSNWTHLFDNRRRNLKIRANGIGKRSSHCMSVIDNTLYVWGGEMISHNHIDSFFYTRKLTEKDQELHQCFNNCNNLCNKTKIIAGKWEKLIPNDLSSPGPRIGHAQVVIDRDIWIFGGRHGSIVLEEFVKYDEFCQPIIEQKSLCDLWKFNVDQNVWTCIETDSSLCPSPRSGHEMIKIDHMIYIFGGSGTKGLLADLHCFDTTTQTWESLDCQTPEYLLGRKDAGFLPSTDHKSLFVVGGFTGKLSNAVFRFDLDNRQWTTVYKEGNETIVPFSASSGLIVKDSLMFFGGKIADDFSNSLLVLDGITGKMCAYDLMKDLDYKIPKARGWADATTWNQHIIIFGGLNDENNQNRFGDNWIKIYQ